jgi:glycosyltransferase involved in cell wall biosynthesis
MIVIVRGPLLSVTGYGCHTRQVWQWARSHKDWDVRASIVPWGQCTYYINPAAEDGLIGDIMSKSIPIPDEKPDLSLQVQLPDEWDPGLAKKNIGITAGIESDRCAQTWVTAARKMTKVVVPSEYAKLSFLNGGLDPDHICNIPEAITCKPPNAATLMGISKDLDSLSTDFNFLMFGQITSNNADTDRKNTFNCLKWLCEELKDDSQAGVVIKTNMGRMTCEDRHHTESMISSVLDHVRVGPFPKVHIIHGLLDSAEIGAIYHHEKINVLVAPTRGEGWGLPILDAASCGLPIIATNHSGHMDFLKHVKFLDVSFDIVNVPDALVDGRIWVAGARWAEPHELHFKSRVKKFRTASSMPKKWAQEAKDTITQNFSLPAIIQSYNENLGAIVDNS